MRRLVLLLLALLCAGCYETKETIRLAADGTGRVLQVTRLDPATQDAALRAFLALYGKVFPDGESPVADPTGERWVRHLASRTSGYAVTLLETRVEDGRRRTTTSGRFDGLRAAAKAGVFPGAAVRLERKGARGWRLSFRHGWGLVGDRSRREIGGRKVDVLAAKVVPALAGWSIERAVVFPSRVLETNGDLDVDGVTVRWRLTIEDLAARSEVEQWALFEERDDLELKPFRVGPDPKTLVRRLLGRPPAERHSGSS